MGLFKKNSMVDVLLGSKYASSVQIFNNLSISLLSLFSRKILTQSKRKQIKCFAKLSFSCKYFLFPCKWILSDCFIKQTLPILTISKLKEYAKFKLDHFSPVLHFM